MVVPGGEMLQKALWIGLGGFLGANARYWLGLWVHGRFGTGFPWGTFAVNVSGAFLLGLLVGLFVERSPLSHAPNLRLLLAVGFLGSYTTFSTVSYDTLSMVQGGSWPLAAANALGSLLAGLAAVWLGVLLGRAL